MNREIVEILGNLKKCKICGGCPVLAKCDEGYVVSHSCGPRDRSFHVGPFKTREEAIAAWIKYEGEDDD